MTNEEMKKAYGNYVVDIERTLTVIKKSTKTKIFDVLKALGATKDNPVSFRDEDGYVLDNAPCYTTNKAGDEPTDAQITEIYIDETDIVRANIHAYYLDEDFDNIDLFDEYELSLIHLLADLVVLL